MGKKLGYILVSILLFVCFVNNVCAKEVEDNADVSIEIKEVNDLTKSDEQDISDKESNSVIEPLDNNDEKELEEPINSLDNEEKNIIQEEVLVQKEENDILKEQEQIVNEEPKTLEDSSTNKETVAIDTDENKSSHLKKAKNDIVQEVYQTQTVKVIIKKVDEENVPLFGAKLQILDSNGNVIDEWVSDGNERVVFLTDGTYILHEVEVPEGYDLASDEEFSVKVEISDITAGVDFDSYPCQHYGGTPLYYVDIDGKKQEVYCINQNWEVPDENSLYDGEILNYNNIRDFTKQTVAVDAANNKEKIDISDQELTNEQLYNKILDIIYHRHKAQDIFADLTTSEIRFLTEAALKNYTNANLTEAVIAYRKANNTTYVPLDEEGVLYDVRNNGDIYYLRHQYKDYVYTPDVELGKNIYTIDFGKGNSFGQMVAYHFSKGHNAKTSIEQRNKIARYYELYQYLINDEEHHPDDFNIFIYSTQSTYSGANPNSDYAYQNLLGVVGYFDTVKEQKQEVVMVNKKSPKIIKKDVETKKNKKEKITHFKKYKNVLGNPKTLDNIMPYILTLFISFILIIQISLKNKTIFN